MGPKFGSPKQSKPKGYILIAWTALVKNDLNGSCLLWLSVNPKFCTQFSSPKKLPMPKMGDIQNGAYVALEGALTTGRILAFGLLRRLRRWLKLEQSLTGDSKNRT